MDFHRDTKCWQCYTEYLNRKESILGKFSPIFSVYTDASKWGYSAICDSDWIVGAFQDEINGRLASILGHHLCIPDRSLCTAHINVQEMGAVVAAAQVWANNWRNSCITFITDNCTVQTALSTGKSLSHEIMELLRQLFWISVRYNFEYKSIYI